jgi:EmrB/QacA subfamily drug resistance transporter
MSASTQSDNGLDRGVMAVAAVVVLGAVMSILDVTVVNVAINTLARDFQTPLSTIQWVATGYTLALATVIPLTGWAADRFGTKRLYMISIALFMLGSAAAGAAWSSGSLIFFRVLQGFGGGMIMPAGMTILTRAAGPQRLGRVMAIIGVPMLLGPILGPILGGYLVDDVSWRWIFYINVPIGIVALIASLRILPKDVPQRHHRLDVLGLALLSPGLALLIYGLAETATEGGMGAVKVLGPMLAGAALIVAFVVHALRTEEPLIDLGLFRNRTFSVASATMILFSVAFFGAMLLMPLYFQVVRGESALQAGLILAPQGLGAMVTMPVSGRLVDRTGPGRIVLAGMVLIVIGFLAYTQLTADTSYWLLEGSLFVMGMGLGATMMPTMSAAMSTLTRAAVAKASTTLNIIQQVGGSIGTATMAVLLTNALSSRLPGVGGGIGAAASIPAQERARVLPLMADAFGSTFTWALVLIGVAFLPALLLPQHKPDPVEDEDGSTPAEAVMVHA